MSLNVVDEVALKIASKSPCVCINGSYSENEEKNLLDISLNFGAKIHTFEEN